MNSAPMSDENEPPSSGDGFSSPVGQPAESGGGDEKSIVELSEIIVHEIRSNTGHTSCCRAHTIFRVPKECLRAADKYTHQPMFLSVGPYHRNDTAMEEMRRNEQAKLSNLGYFVEQGGPSVLQYTQAVASMESEARSCYEGDVQMERDAFCKMLLLDAVQLILLLQFLGQEQEQSVVRVRASGNRKKKKDVGRSSAPTPTAGSHGTAQGCKIKTRSMTMTVHDLMMLENQIPFFVVEKIYKLCYADADAAAAGNGSVTPVNKLAWGIIKAIMVDIPPVSDDGVVECNHLVHLCHLYFKPTSVADTLLIYPHKYGRFRQATEYYEAGVRFRRWDAEDGSRRPLLDVKFSDGVLRMALQTVDEKTGYLLRNVLAYEQKYYWEAINAGTSYVTAYVVFMSQLLSCPEDVALLSRLGVMEHLLGNDGEVCALFRSLSDGLVFDPSSEHYLNPVGVALLARCRSSLPRWCAWIVRHRFSNPWLVAAWVFGASWLCWAPSSRRCILCSDTIVIPKWWICEL